MWDNVLGHNQIKAFLEQYLHKEERPHALLFSGAEGLGKRRLALEFARSLLCFNHSGGDDCDACRLMNLEARNFSHPDFLHIRREEDPKTLRLKDISIEQIRDLLSKSAFASVMSSTKVCLIEDIDRMSEAAANSFLKLLEEPPAGWVFILLAVAPDKLLSTILSRVVQLRFNAVPVDLVEAMLKSQVLAEEGISAAHIPVLARLSEGSVGLAVEYGRKEVLAYREQAYAFLEALPLDAAVNYLQGRVWLEKYERNEALLFVQMLQLLLRDLLICRLGTDAELYNCDLEKELHMLSKNWQLKSLKEALKVVNDTYAALVANAGIKLCMEAMAIKIDILSKE